MKLPTREEINVHNSLDQRTAAENFFGKTLQDAETMFRENFLTYQEDLMWMGQVAFRFYVPAAIQYLQSPESKNDSDAINCFLGLLEFRSEHEPESLQPVFKELIEVCRYVINHYERFDVTPEIYGDLRPRYEKLIQQLSQNS